MVAISLAVSNVLSGRKYHPASLHASDHSTSPTPLGSSAATASPGLHARGRGAGARAGGRARRARRSCTRRRARRRSQAGRGGPRRSTRNRDAGPRPTPSAEAGRLLRGHARLLARGRVPDVGVDDPGLQRGGAGGSRATPRSPAPCPGWPPGDAPRSPPPAGAPLDHSSSRGTTSVTMPSRNAVAAVRRSSFPSSAQRRTSPSGTLRCSSPIGSSTDVTPRDACGSKKVASSEQMMMSDSFTKYWPPPAHMPCTAATTGFQHLCAFGPSRNPGSAWFQMLRWYHQTPSVTSMPVQNARSPSARQHDGVDVVGVAHGAPGVDDLRGHRLVERVEGLGPVQRDGGDVVVTDLEGDRGVVAHGVLLYVAALSACRVSGR